MDEQERQERSAEDAPVVRLVNQIFMDAVRRRVTEIRIAPTETRLSVDYLQGGILTSHMLPPKKMQQGIIVRLKILGQLDLARKDVRQEGQFRLKIRKGEERDFRIATEPTSFGEKVTIWLN